VIPSFALKLRPDFLRSIESEISNTLYASKPTILELDRYFRSCALALLRCWMKQNRKRRVARMLRQDNEIMALFHFHEIHASTKVQVMNVCVIIFHEGRRASIFGHGISRTCFYVVAPAKLCSKERNFETMQTHTKSNFIPARARARGC